MESNDLRARLIDAAAAGEIIRVMYRRGSQLGTIREIAPMVVSDDEIRARDVAAGIDKTFKLAHLNLANANTDLPSYDPTQPVEGTRTLGAPSNRTSLNFVARLVRRIGRHQCLLHRFFNNGKPRMAADVAILFNEFAIDAWDGGNGWREEAVRSTRPYYVPSPTFERPKKGLGGLMPPRTHGS